MIKTLIASPVGVVILEDWEFRSSSPYPNTHRHLSLHSLLAVFPSVPVLSIPKMSEKERARFLRLRTFLSTLSQGGLEEFTRAQLEVDCGSYQCVSINRSDGVYLNDQGQHSRDVKLSLEELTYTQSGLQPIYKEERSRLFTLSLSDENFHQRRQSKDSSIPNLRKRIATFLTSGSRSDSVFHN